MVARYNQAKHRLGRMLGCGYYSYGILCAPLLVIYGLMDRDRTRRRPLPSTRMRSLGRGHRFGSRIRDIQSTSAIIDTILNLHTFASPFMQPIHLQGSCQMDEYSPTLLPRIPLSSLRDERCEWPCGPHDLLSICICWYYLFLHCGDEVNREGSRVLKPDPLYRCCAYISV